LGEDILRGTPSLWIRKGTVEGRGGEGRGEKSLARGEEKKRKWGADYLKRRATRAGVQEEDRYLAKRGERKIGRSCSQVIGKGSAPPLLTQKRKKGRENPLLSVSGGKKNTVGLPLLGRKRKDRCPIEKNSNRNKSFFILEQGEEERANFKMEGLGRKHNRL